MSFDIRQEKEFLC